MNRAVDWRIPRTEMACWRAIALQAVQHRRSQGSLWLSWTLLALALVFGALAPITREPLKVASFGVGVPIGMLVLMWWTFLVDSIRRQYHPAAARLVPLLPQRLRAVAALAWLLGASAMAVLVGIPFGHPGLVFTIAGLALLEVARARAYLLFVLFVLLKWLHVPVEALLTLLVTSPAAAPAGLAVLVLEGRSTLRHLFGGPGALPTLGVDDADGWPQAATDGPAGLAQGDQARAGSNPFGVLLRSAMSWRQHLLRVGLVAAAALALGLALHGDEVKLGALHLAILVMLSGATVAHGSAVTSRMYETAGEQALLRSSARAPGAERLNGVLGRWLVRDFLVHWTSLLAVALAALLLAGAGWRGAANAIVMFSFALLTLGYRLRDFSRSRRSETLLEVIGFAVALLAFGFAIVAQVARPSLGAACAVAGVNLLLALAFAMFRWRAMVAAPPVFPAARNQRR